MNKAVTFDDVRYCYDNVCALADVRLSVPAHALTALVGPNGGGKSTLIRLMAGLLTPNAGAVSGCRSVGYVPQHIGFDNSFPLTVRELVLMGTLDPKLRPYYRYTAAQKGAADEAICRVGLTHVAGRGIEQLSGGQRGRAMIARALASKADILALDEPDASLDIDAARELYALLLTLKTDKTIVIASHHVGAVLDIADYAAYVNGTVSCFVSPDRLKTKLKGGMAL